MTDSRAQYRIGVDIGGTHGSSVGGRAFRLAVGVLADYRRGPAASSLRRGYVKKGGEMATDLKVSVRRQIDRLRKELAVATGRVAALQDEIKRHELVYGMLDGRKLGKRSQRGPSTVGSLKRGPRGAMIDWNAVFATLPNQFTLETISAHKTARYRPRRAFPLFSAEGGR